MPRDRTALEYDAETLARAELDSAALVTEPTLKAWGLPFYFVQEESDMPSLSEAFSRAESQSQPVAVLITADLG